MTVSSPSGHKTPRNHTEALDLDRENGNSKWVDPKNLELSRLKALEVTTAFPPHFAYTIKHDNRYKCRAVTSYPQPCASDMSTGDRGANGGVAGNNTRLISHDFPARLIDIEGINNHIVPRLKLGTHGAAAHTNQGKVILIFHQYASYAQGQLIHSLLQLEDNNITVDDHPTTLGRSQSLTTSNGLVIPLEFVNGLARLNLRPYTDDALYILPHITSL